MVCTKCAAKSRTTLATPSVKHKSEQYYGSPATKASTDKKSTSAATAGVGKSKLLSKSAKNPYAAYSASCEKCKVKVEQGKSYCQKCAYKDNRCAMCGKNMAGDKSKQSVPVVQGQRYSAK